MVVIGLATEPRTRREAPVKDFAVFLLGLAASNPREYRRLLRIRAAIYRRVAPLEARIVRSAEPIRFADLDHTSFAPLRPGTPWGGVFDCAWIELTGDVPEGVVDPIVLLGIRGEGLVYDQDGAPLDAVTTVFQQADLPHSGGKYRPVRGVDASSGRVHLFADVAHNGFILYEVGKAKYHGAWVAERDEQAFALYYDYMALLVLADATRGAPLAAQLREALEDAYARSRTGDVPGARAALAPHLDAPSESAFTYTAIGHGHLDMAWLWPLRETHRKAARTYIRQLNNIDAEPDFLYGTSQPQQLLWMKQEHPALFARIKEAAAAGRIELQGAFWIEPDTNLPSGESLIRQALHGRRFWEEEFGVAREDLRVCWLPDTFGYSGNLPQILRGTGMDFFQTIKLAWNKVTTFPHRTFRWAGIDGSDVLVHMPPEGDYNSRGAADGLLKGIDQYPERDLDSALLVFGSGDGGGGPGEIHLELQRRERSLRGLPKVTPGTADGFFRALEAREHSGAAELPTHRGELYLEAHQGTYTTAAATKKHNRRSERLLHEAEALAALTGTSSRDVLDPLWQTVLLNQFHDIIPGSSIERVNREARAAYDRVEAALESDIARRIGHLPRPESERADASERSVVALNLTSFARREHVRADGEWRLAEVGPYASATLAPAESPGELFSDAEAMGNGILTLRFAADGSIASCVDADGVDHAGGGLNRLVLHEDPYVFPFNAWDIDAGYVDKAPVVLRPVRVEHTIDGPMAVRRTRYRGPGVELVQTVVLEAGSAVVRCHTKAEWRQRHRMLRAEFRPAHFGDTVRCEIQFGHIERRTTQLTDAERAQFEICAHKWIAVGDDEAGFALLNDSKYGHRAKDSLLSLNLLRSPTYPDPTVDRGAHEFTYAFHPLEGSDVSAAVREGYRLNNPLRVMPGDAMPSAARSSEPGVVIETVKPAEDGDGVVLRLYESLGRETVTRLSTTMPHARVVETDMLEVGEAAVDLEALSFRPFQVRTFRLCG